MRMIPSERSAVDLSICERVGDLAGELHVRVGITTGEAMVTLPAEGHPDAIGDVMNTAARLEAAAPTDGVLVDDMDVSGDQPCDRVSGARGDRREGEG